MKIIETLTIEQVMDEMRSRGLGMSYKKLTAWADAGILPFAVSAPDTRGVPQRTFFKKPLIKWLDELTDEIFTEEEPRYEYEELERVHHAESLI